MARGSRAGEKERTRAPSQIKDITGRRTRAWKTDCSFRSKAETARQKRRRWRIDLMQTHKLLHRRPSYVTSRLLVPAPACVINTNQRRLTFHCLAKAIRHAHLACVSLQRPVKARTTYRLFDGDLEASKLSVYPDLIHPDCILSA